MSPSGEDAVDGPNRGVETQDSSAVDDGQWEDYTCQGSWEDFIRALEGVLRDWKSCNTGASDTRPTHSRAATRNRAATRSAVRIYTP